MSVFPDLISDGYQIEAELGRNREGGRIVWQGIALDSQQTVVIKQFCFAQANSSWSGYKAYAREIAILQNLEHPYIPRYLDSIETETGFCLIQEYIAADNCDRHRSLSIAEVKQVAINILDILIYLQEQNPPILHQDIKPDNILLDESLNAYLIDFGFSRPGSIEISGSSVFKGTPGFIAPEQIIQPTTASDIYSLGVTLVCLLTNKNIVEVRACASADDPYQLKLGTLLPNLDRPLLNWLQTMTNSKVSQRFPDALTAKNALLELDLPIEAVEVTTLSTLPPGSWLEPRAMTGTVGIISLTSVAVWGVEFAREQTELTLAKMAIAIIASLAIGIVQLGAAAIVSSDRQARSQGIVLSLLVPILLVASSSLIWGIQEAVIISAAIALGEIVLLSYYWWQIPSSMIIKMSLWSSAIAIGITLGLKLI